MTNGVPVWPPDSSPNQLLNIHRTNLLARLEQRIAAAQIRHDEQLLALLEQERQQLQMGWGQSNDGNRLVRFWQWLERALWSPPELQVKSLQDKAGQLWWYAFDPRTGKTLYAESETDVIKWIEDNHLGC
ncbi:hypothetical protein XM38_008700 [Halomicronema hongdechloris C2206]|uniref:Uncharacterized protein n=1 Tax=Halomicronema hongdechloris C2206 TaxID=1641165 RepID=A0A1Z3HI29_9CYAN|nr:hypothetical protein [Halomicronema hongdechloris]ASC69940.1 hypothetical protein XM38_008700 [Halomicronema hongdechloris C2206]